MSQCMDVCLPGPKKVAVVKRWALAEGLNGVNR